MFKLKELLEMPIKHLKLKVKELGIYSGRGLADEKAREYQLAKNVLIKRTAANGSKEKRVAEAYIVKLLKIQGIQKVFQRRISNALRRATLQREDGVTRSLPQLGSRKFPVEFPKFDLERTKQDAIAEYIVARTNIGRWSDFEEGIQWVSSHCISKGKLISAKSLRRVVSKVNGRIDLDRKNPKKIVEDFEKKFEIKVE